jgi:hypothetical protein
VTPEFVRQITGPATRSLPENPAAVLESLAAEITSGKSGTIERMLVIRRSPVRR